MEAARQLERFVDTIDQSILYFEAPLVSSMQGQLVIVGSGIRAISDMTLDAEAQVRAAQKALYCVGDPVTERKLHTLNPSAESLYGLYGKANLGWIHIERMLEAILSPLRAGLRVCVVYYGHPGVFAWSTHQAVRLARREGYRAQMHAGISADARYLRILASTRRRRVVTRLRQRIFSSGAENRTSLRMSCFGKWNARRLGIPLLRIQTAQLSHIDRETSHVLPVYPPRYYLRSHTAAQRLSSTCFS